MRHRLFRLVVVIALLAAGFAFSQDVIRDIQVKRLDTFAGDAGSVLAVCSSRVGAPVSQADLSRDVRALLDTGQYSYAGVELVAVDGGMRVIYVVKRRHIYVAPPEIVGNTKYGKSRIIEWLDLKDGAFVDDQVLAVRSAKIRDEYAKRHYSNIAVTAELLETDATNGMAHVIVRIEEGARAKVNDFLFEGVTVFKSDELRASFGQRPWYDPRGWFIDAPYDDQTFEVARENVREKYLDKGYLDVKVAEPRLEPTGKGKVNVVFAVEEGVPYVVESLVLTGISLFPTNALEDVTLVQSGDIAGRSTIQSAVKNVRDYYGARGYIDTMVRPTVETSEENPGKASIKLEVREGALVRIRNIVIQGNTRTKDKVIRREIATAIAPGEVMNEPLIERSENRIKNLNYFTEVRHYTAPGDTEENRDLVFDLKEQLRTGKFMIGAGFSSVDGVVGFAEVNQSNFDIANWPYFTGGGQKARAGVELGSKRQTVELGWTEPWFLDKPMALSVELYRRMRSYTEYDETRTGAGVGISYPVKVGRIGFKYTLEQINLDDQLWGPYFRSEWWHPGYFLGAYRFTDEKDSAFNSSLRVSWTHDTRDQAFVPTRGMLLTVFGEVAGAVLGGENDIYSVGAQVRRWFKMPWNEKHVLSLRARFETVEAYSGDVPIYERLYLGGGRTVRGIDYRDIGPKVIGLNRKWHPIGGQTLVNAGAEYSIPLFDKVRIAGFTDFGSLDEDAFAPDFSDIAVTAGLGLRIDIPGFPVRLDYATPIVKPDNADTSAFVLWIGFE